GGAGPEDLAEHGRVLDEPLLVGAEAVEPCGDDALDRLGELVGGPALDIEPCELLRIERVATRSFEELALRCRGEERLFEDVLDDPCRFVVGERRERERRRVELAAAPTRTTVEQLRARSP